MSSIAIKASQLAIGEVDVLSRRTFVGGMLSTVVINSRSAFGEAAYQTGQ